MQCARRKNLRDYAPHTPRLTGLYHLEHVESLVTPVGKNRSQEDCTRNFQCLYLKMPHNFHCYFIGINQLQWPHLTSRGWKFKGAYGMFGDNYCNICIIHSMYQFIIILIKPISFTRVETPQRQEKCLFWSLIYSKHLLYIAGT